jgi:cytochrome P450
MAANRDPDAFKDPFDLNSGGRLPSTFGFGKHVCPGKQLAGLAVEVFLRELYEFAPLASRHPDLLFSGADVSIRQNETVGWTHGRPHHSSCAPHYRQVRPA